MSPKSLFIIILRIIGLLLLVQGIIALPRLIQTIEPLFNGGNFSGFVFGLLVTFILTVLIYVLLIKYLLFKPDMIIDKLSLDKNFDEEKFELNIHSSTLIRIAIIIIGGITFIDYFVPLLRNIYSFVKSKNDGGILRLFDNSSVSGLDLIQGSAMVLISYLLITNSRSLTNWIEHLRRK